jgi:hypothetical protein
MPPTKPHWPLPNNANAWFNIRVLSRKQALWVALAL